MQRLLKLRKWFRLEKMNADDILEKLKSYFQTCAEKHNVDLAFLYGSWAAGRPKTASDVDVAVMFLGEPGQETAFERVTTFSLELTRLLNRETNVLVLDRELSKPMLHYNAIVHGTPVYVRDFTRYADVKLQALAQAEDFTIFGTAWQAEVIKHRVEAVRHA